LEEEEKKSANFSNNLNLLQALFSSFAKTRKFVEKNKQKIEGRSLAHND